MPNQKKFTPYIGITVGSLGLIANTIALTMYYSSLSPLIAGGMIGSTGPLVACTFVSIFALYADRSSLNKIYGNTYDQERINEKAELFNEARKGIVPTIVGVAASFGIGAGLAALGFTSPAAIIALTVIAGTVVMSLISKAIEPSSIPPAPGGGLINAEVNIRSANCTI